MDVSSEKKIVNIHDTIRVRLLKSEEDFKKLDFKSFDCGDEEYNIPIKESTQLFLHNKNHNTRVYLYYVNLDCGKKKMIAYMSICASNYSKEHLNNKFKRKCKFSYGSALMISYIAVDKTFQGKKIGKAILEHSFNILLEMNKKTGIFLMHLHAEPQAVKFYKSVGFLPGNKIDGRLSMYFPTEKIIAMDLKGSLQFDDAS